MKSIDSCEPERRNQRVKWRIVSAPVKKDECVKIQSTDAVRQEESAMQITK
jgi:hypothetical protein